MARYELPGLSVVKVLVDTTRYHEGNNAIHADYEWFFLDSEGDALMCFCSDPETSGMAPGWCASHTARNLYELASNIMWLTDQDRLMVEDMVRRNRSCVQMAVIT